MLDVIQRVLTWFLTIEVIGFLASCLTAVGISPQIATFLVIAGSLFTIYKVTSDRYMLQRWRRRINGWRRFDGR